MNIYEHILYKIVYVYKYLCMFIHICTYSWTKNFLSMNIYGICNYFTEVLVIILFKFDHYYQTFFQYAFCIIRHNSIILTLSAEIKLTVSKLKLAICRAITGLCKLRNNNNYYL